MVDNRSYTDPEKREYVDPEERIRPMPILPAAIAVGMVLWGIVYLFLAGPITPSEFGDQRTLADLREQPAGAAAGAAVDGKAIYAANCAACHQATGAGLPGVFPPLADSEWVMGEPRVLINILLHGLEGEVEVAGATYSGQMPAFAQLDDAELAGLANYIRGDWGNSADAAIEPDLVQEERDAARRDAPFDGGTDLEQLAGELD